MENNQAEIIRLNETVQEVAAKDLREVAELQLAVTTMGWAEVSLS
jgi:hypothetical protein